MMTPDKLAVAVNELFGPPRVVLNDDCTGEQRDEARLLAVKAGEAIALHALTLLGSIADSLKVIADSKRRR